MIWKIAKAFRLDSKRTRGIEYCPTEKYIDLFHNELVNYAQDRLFTGIIVRFVMYHGQMEVQVGAHNLPSCSQANRAELGCFVSWTYNRRESRRRWIET